MDKKLGRWAAALVALAACIVMLSGLGIAPLQDYDEATYAQVTHEMLLSGNYLAPTHTGEPYFEKPPLYFWAAALSSKVFGESELALRLPSALAGIGLILVVIALAYELSGSLGAGALAGAIALTMAPVAEVARQVRVDVPLAFFIAFASYAWLKAQKDPRWYLWFGALAGLAFMTKDVIAFFAAVAALLWALCDLNFNFLKSRYFWWGSGVFLVVVLPWHIYMTVQFGLAFWQTYLFYDVFARTSQNLFAVSITNHDYIWYLANFAAPWAQLFLPALVVLIIWQHRFERRARLGAAWAASMVAAMLALFFYSATKAPTYLIPLYPFAAICLAIVISSVVRGAFERDGARTEQISSKKFVYPRAILLFAIGACLILGTTSTIYNAFHFNPYYAQTDELAREEKMIGLDMRAAHQPFFAFQTTTLGSIMYYSGDIHPLALTNSTSVGSYIVLPTASQKALSELYPTLSTSMIYQGAQLTLLRVLSED